MRAGGDLLADGRRQEVEHELDGRALAGHVVLQVRVEALVAQVELGREGDQDNVDVERPQPEPRHEPAASFGRLAGRVDREEGLPGAALEQSLRVVERDVQPPERVGREPVPEARLGAADGLGDQDVQPFER